MTPTKTVVPSSHQEDLVMSKTLHADTWEEGHHTFFSKLRKKDRSVQPMIVDRYLTHQKDQISTNVEEAKAERTDVYKIISNSFYELATDYYEQAIARHEHYLASRMGLQPGMKVLDVGCGVGGPAREICDFTGAHITSINNNNYQISRARRLTAQAKLERRCEFVKGDFMAMPFGDTTFDAVYAIEATVHAQTLEGVYGEIYRVLKPGGVFGCFEWVMTDKFDPQNPAHHRIQRNIEIGNGISNMRTAKECLQALESVGFVLHYQTDMVADYDDEIKWYAPLQGLSVAQPNILMNFMQQFRATPVGRATTTYMLIALEKMGLVSPGSAKVSNILQTGADALVEGAILEIFTPFYFFVAHKA
ncbi:hypothetical protein EC968_006187 [Mortierella alpina]|nr:hypothetical protein EC968_006187 [Mortierella alpina]